MKKVYPEYDRKIKELVALMKAEHNGRIGAADRVKFGSGKEILVKKDQWINEYEGRVYSTIGVQDDLAEYWTINTEYRMADVYGGYAKWVYTNGTTKYLNLNKNVSEIAQSRSPVLHTLIDLMHKAAQTDIPFVKLVADLDLADFKKAARAKARKFENRNSVNYEDSLKVAVKDAEGEFELMADKRVFVIGEELPEIKQKVTLGIKDSTLFAKVRQNPKGKSVVVDYDLVDEKLYKSIDLDTDAGLKKFESLSEAQRLVYKSKLIDDYLDEFFYDAWHKRLTSISREKLTPDNLKLMKVFDRNKGIAKEFLMQKVPVELIQGAKNKRVYIRQLNDPEVIATNYYRSFAEKRRRGSEPFEFEVSLARYESNARIFRTALAHEFHHFIDDYLFKTDKLNSFDNLPHYHSRIIKEFKDRVGSEKIAYNSVFQGDGIRDKFINDYEGRQYGFGDSKDFDWSEHFTVNLEYRLPKSYGSQVSLITREGKGKFLLVDEHVGNIAQARSPALHTFFDLMDGISDNGLTLRQAFGKVNKKKFDELVERKKRQHKDGNDFELFDPESALKNLSKMSLLRAEEEFKRKVWKIVDERENASKITRRNFEYKKAGAKIKAKSGEVKVIDIDGDGKTSIAPKPAPKPAVKPKAVKPAKRPEIKIKAKESVGGTMREILKKDPNISAKDAIIIIRDLGFKNPETTLKTQYSRVKKELKLAPKPAAKPVTAKPKAETKPIEKLPKEAEVKITRVTVDNSLIDNKTYKKIDFDSEDGLAVYEGLNANQKLTFKSRLIDDYMDKNFDILKNFDDPKIKIGNTGLDGNEMRAVFKDYFMQNASPDIIQQAAKKGIKIRADGIGGNYYMSYRYAGRKGVDLDEIGINLEITDVKDKWAFRANLQHEFHHFIDDLLTESTRKLGKESIKTVGRSLNWKANSLVKKVYPKYDENIQAIAGILRKEFADKTGKTKTIRYDAGIELKIQTDRYINDYEGRRYKIKNDSAEFLAVNSEYRVPDIYGAYQSQVFTNKSIKNLIVNKRISEIAQARSPALHTFSDLLREAAQKDVPLTKLIAGIDAKEFKRRVKLKAEKFKNKDVNLKREYIADDVKTAAIRGDGTTAPSVSIRQFSYGKLKPEPKPKPIKIEPKSKTQTIKIGTLDETMERVLKVNRNMTTKQAIAEMRKLGFKNPASTLTVKYYKARKKMKPKPAPKPAAKPAAIKPAKRSEIKIKAKETVGATMREILKKDANILSLIHI